MPFFVPSYPGITSTNVSINTDNIVTTVTKDCKSANNLNVFQIILTNNHGNNIIWEYVDKSRRDSDYSLLLSPSVTANVTVSDFVYGEIATGVINGSNNVFTTAFNFIISTIQVFVNGIEQTVINDFVLSGQNILLNTSPITGDIVTVNYVKS